MTAVGAEPALMSPPAYPRTPRVESALDLLFPPICVGCRRVGRWICRRCWSDVHWLIDEICGVCGRPSALNPCPRCNSSPGPLDGVVAVAEFEGPAREAVHGLKYENRHAISGLMGRLMAGACRHVAPDAVVHVPLHASRRRERGYDQAGMLARHLATSLDISCYSNALTRIRKTRQQVGLGPAERRNNVDGAFGARKRLDGAHLLLVDDVYTTGSTLRAAAGALREAGAERITAAVFARAQAGRDGGR